MHNTIIACMCVDTSSIIFNKTEIINVIIAYYCTIIFKPYWNKACCINSIILYQSFFTQIMNTYLSYACPSGIIWITHARVFTSVGNFTISNSKRDGCTTFILHVDTIIEAIVDSTIFNCKIVVVCAMNSISTRVCY